MNSEKLDYMLETPCMEHYSDTEGRRSDNVLPADNQQVVWMLAFIFNLRDFTLSTPLSGVEDKVRSHRRL